MKYTLYPFFSVLLLLFYLFILLSLMCVWGGDTDFFYTLLCKHTEILIQRIMMNRRKIFHHLFWNVRIFLDLLFILCLLCACVNLCAPHYAGAHRSQKRTSGSLEMNHRQLWAIMWVLGNEPRSSAKRICS